MNFCKNAYKIKRLGLELTLRLILSNCLKGSDHSSC